MADGLSGIASSMDWGALVEAEIKKARKPAEQWEKQIDTLELKKEVYIISDEYHTRYLTQQTEPSLHAVGMAYIRFAREERHLFHFAAARSGRAERGSFL